MSLTRRLMGGETIERRGPTGPWGDTTPPPPGGGGLFGPTNEQTALQILTVLACVGVLADAVATLPLYAYQRGPGSRRPVDPPPPLIAQPFVEITLQDWLTQLMVSLALRGNGYGLVIQRDDMGFPVQVAPVHPDAVGVKRDQRSGHRVYRVNGEVKDTADVLHVPAIMLPGALVGLNPIECARITFGLARASEAFAASFFGNSANPSGVIQVPGSLNPTETFEMAKAWIAAHQGSQNANLPAVLTGGAEFKPISITPDDAQFIETRNLSRLEIAMMFRVPPHMLGDVDRTTSWGAGIEQQEIGFVTNTLRPWLNRIESHLSTLLPGNMFCKFNLSGRLRGDTLQRFQAHTLARFGGWENVDEIREKEDMAPLPDGLGEQYLQPLNYAPAGAAPPGQAPPGGPAADSGGDSPSAAAQRASAQLLEALMSFATTGPVTTNGNGHKE